MHCFSFDIETVPDVEFGRRMWGLEGLPDDEVGTAMTFLRQQQTGSDFLPLHQHCVVAISVALRSGDSFRVWSLGDEESSEAEIVGRFFDGIERYAPDLVSWNGSGFDLPVLHYRALRHGIQAPRYWEVGDSDREYKWNNYLGRDKVRERWLSGGISEIRDYCETDVLNTWLIYLRFEFMRGNLDATGLEREFALVRETLAGMNVPHLNEFLDAWPEPG
jgi:predicted PolB exonuclease-like 3'-5' exonuclease